ncbi:hypothetical protein B5X24_HaOG210787 [Helicoverpa armigera]|nr:hypothetical protein B5X24_HaOG210787 [Helicoverpa armigera]
MLLLLSVDSASSTGKSSCIGSCFFFGTISYCQMCYGASTHAAGFQTILPLNAGRRLYRRLPAACRFVISLFTFMKLYEDDSRHRVFLVSTCV